MKTKRIVIGAMAAMMFSTSICSLATAAAADDTVQIIVGNTTAKAGGEYELEVSLADIPTTGAQGINFSLEFDKSLISVESVEIGKLANTAAVNADSTGASLPVFDTYIDNENGFISLIWSTSSKDASYWLQGSGVFCTMKSNCCFCSGSMVFSFMIVVPSIRFLLSCEKHRRASSSPSLR